MKERERERERESWKPMMEGRKEGMKKEKKELIKMKGKTRKKEAVETKCCFKDENKKRSRIRTCKKRGARENEWVVF